MKKSKIDCKDNIMRCFKMCPDHDISTELLFQIAQRHGIFIPSAVNTHLSQMCKKEMIQKVRRGVYRYIPQDFTGFYEEMKQKLHTAHDTAQAEVLCARSFVEAGCKKYMPSLLEQLEKNAPKNFHTFTSLNDKTK